MARTRLSVGDIAIPEGWEERVEVTLLEPARSAGPTRTARAAAPTLPRSNLVVSRRAAQQPTATAACAAFLDGFRREQPGVTVDGERTFAFDDGVVGAEVVFTFPATPTLIVAQRHVFRIDDGVVTQLVVTQAASERHRDADVFERTLKSFRPA